jgi:hypothetical protein
MTDLELQTYLVEHIERLLDRWGRWLSAEDSKVLHAQRELYQTDMDSVTKLNKILGAS